MSCQKIAFIHYGKVAGRFINNYLNHNILGSPTEPIERQNYKKLNSWNMQFSLGRDWTDGELFEIAIDRSDYQLPNPGQLKVHNSLWNHGYLDRQFVHNHHINWTLNSVREFNRNGWLTFMFLKDPVELLLSLYFWGRDSIVSGAISAQIFEPAYLLDLTLDEFLVEIVKCDNNTRRIYNLPDYIREVSHVAKFSTENFTLFLDKQFEHEFSEDRVDAKWRYPSSNKGIDHYLASGEISHKTIDYLSSVDEIAEFREFLSSGSPR